jgi:hypothetical protein
MGDTFSSVFEGFPNWLWFIREIFRVGAMMGDKWRHQSQLPGRA